MRTWASILPVALLLAAPAPREKAPPLSPKKAARYDRTLLEGFTVYVNQRLLEDGNPLGRKALTLLRVQLYQVSRVVPPKALARLRRIPIWLEEDDPKVICACYHPSRRWLEENGLDPAKARCVEIGNARRFLAWSRNQPWMVLHELAHGYHHRVLGWKDQAVLGAYRKAKASGRYRSVLHMDGKRRPAYAMKNPKEYFAECTEAFFGTNDMFPFVRAELKEFDPLMFRTLEKIWSR